MILIFLPHQDDEFFIHPLISEAASNGLLVKIFYITNGVFKNFSAETRSNESILALKKIGVGEDSIFMYGHIYNINDGKIIFNLNLVYEIIDKVFNSIDVGKVKKILIPGYEGGHHDHDALNFMVGFVARKYSCTEKIEQFYLYNCYRIPKPLFRVMTPVGSNNIILYKLSLPQIISMLLSVRFYKSQFLTFFGLLPPVIFNLLQKRSISLCTLKYTEDINRPHNGLLLYERRKRFEFNIFKEKIESFKEAREKI